MTESCEQIRESVDTLYLLESRRIRATLIRLLGDFDPAEDALHGLNGAIKIAEKIPGARRGTVEVRPVMELTG